MESLGQVETEEDLALIEDRPLAGVQVLGHGIVEGATTEAYHTPFGVPDGEDEATAKQVLSRAFLGLGNQTGEGKLAFRVPQGEEMAPQGRTVIGAETKLELGDGFRGDPPSIHVGARFDTLGGGQVTSEEAASGFGELEEGVFALPPLLGGNLSPCHSGQVLQRLTKVHVLPLHVEGEDVAARGTGSKASPTLAVGEDEEGRRFLRVEGTEGLEAGARLLKGHVAGNQVCDVELGFYVIDHGHGVGFNLPVMKDVGNITLCTFYCIPLPKNQ